MFKKARRATDAFTFSLGGMRTVSSFFAMQAVADDRINRIRDAQLKMLETRRAEAAWDAGGPSEDGPELCTHSA